jgi:Tol biopolymer transport system component
MDAEGNLAPLRAVAEDYRNIHFSPDGHRLARASAKARKWTCGSRVEQDTLSRLTFDASEDGSPLWAPDGQSIAFSSTRAETAVENLYCQRADGTGEAGRITESANRQVPTSWHPSGKFLAFSEVHPQTDWDILILPLEGDEVSGWKPGNPSAFLDTPFAEAWATFSPDGRWLRTAPTSRGQARSTCALSRARAGEARSRPAENVSVWSRNDKLFYWWEGRSGSPRIPFLGTPFVPRSPECGRRGACRRA